MEKIKISFDFDDTLSLEKIQNIVRKLNKNEIDIFILTSRFGNMQRMKYKNLKSNEDIYLLASDLGIPPHRISFTNQSPKWMVLNESGIQIHIDDDEREIHNIKYHGIVKPFSVHDENLEENLFSYIEALKEF